jgi:hypothetical protein
MVQHITLHKAFFLFVKNARNGVGVIIENYALSVKTLCPMFLGGILVRASRARLSSGKTSSVNVEYCIFL